VRLYTHRDLETLMGGVEITGHKLITNQGNFTIFLSEQPLHDLKTMTEKLYDNKWS
jgi:hypothetical protein